MLYLKLIAMVYLACFENIQFNFYDHYCSTSQLLLQQHQPIHTTIQLASTTNYIQSFLKMSQVQTQDQSQNQIKSNNNILPRTYRIGQFVQISPYTYGYIMKSYGNSKIIDEQTTVQVRQNLPSSSCGFLVNISAGFLVPID